MTEIRQRAVLQSVLLKLLQEYPDGRAISDVYDLLSARYSFPEDWYRELPSASGYDHLRDLGIGDWRALPQAKLVELVPTEPQWQNELRWARNELRKRGLLDLSAPRGIWRLTAKGLKATTADLDFEPNGVEKELLRGEKRSDVPGGSRHKVEKPQEQSSRTYLLDKLILLTTSMALPDLELLVEIARSIRIRSLPEAVETPSGRCPRCGGLILKMHGTGAWDGVDERGNLTGGAMYGATCPQCGEHLVSGGSYSASPGELKWASAQV